MTKKKFGLMDGVLALGLAMIIGGLALAVKGGEQVEDVKLIREGAIYESPVQQSKVYIDISGAVETPGVYELKTGDRLIDVLKICGGLSRDADRDWVDKNINRARVVKDGEKIYIPKVGQVGAIHESPVQGANRESPVQGISNDQNKLVNLNKADIAELDKLPGVGPAIAQRIIDYRESNGGFVSVEEIKLVSGIGDKMFEKIKDLIEI